MVSGEGTGGASSGGVSVRGGAPSGGAGVTVLDASAGGRPLRDASSTKGSHDAGIDARLRDAGPESDASPFDWINPCPPGSDFPAGTYQLQVYRVQNYTPAVLVTSPQPAVRGAQNTAYVSNVMTVEMTITPAAHGGAGLFDVMVPLPLRRAGSVISIRGFPAAASGNDVATFNSFEAEGGSSSGRALYFRVLERSGFVYDLTASNSDGMDEFWGDAYVGTGVRVCDAIADGGAHVPALPNEDGPKAPPPGCSLITFNDANLSCDPSNWPRDFLITDPDCTAGHTSCTTDGMRMVATCCPGTPLF
jgi:hypothetical protein